MKLNSEAVNKITHDWSSAFPNLSIYKPLWLLKRYGPIIIGICLNRDSSDDRYLPISHLHNLCSGSEYLTLSLKTELKSGYRKVSNKIRVDNHERDWQQSAEKLRRESYVSLDSEGLSISKVKDWYLDYVNVDPLAKFSPKVFEDIYSLQLYCGKISEAQRDLIHFKELIDSWPRPISHKIGGSSHWVEKTLERFPSQEFVVARVSHLIKKLQLEKIQVGVFNCEG